MTTLSRHGVYIVAALLITVHAKRVGAQGYGIGPLFAYKNNTGTEITSPLEAEEDFDLVFAFDVDGSTISAEEHPAGSITLQLGGATYDGLIDPVSVPPGFACSVGVSSALVCTWRTFTNVGFSTLIGINLKAPNLPEAASFTIQATVNPYDSDLAAIGSMMTQSKMLDVLAGEMGPAFDLSIEVIPPGTPVVAGTEFSYLVEIRHLSGDEVDAVALRTLVDEGFQIISAAAQPGTCTNTGDREAQCTGIGPLAQGDVELIEVTAVATNDAGDYLVTGAFLPQGFTDANLENNEFVGEISVVAIGPADLSIQKTVDKERSGHGEEIEYTLTVRNHGPNAAENVVVHDDGPKRDGDPDAGEEGTVPLVEILDATIGRGSCTMVGEVADVNCDIPILTPGEILVISITAKVLEADTLVNRALVTADTEDPNLENNEDEATSDATNPLKVVADPEAQYVKPGETGSASFHMTNVDQAIVNTAWEVFLTNALGLRITDCSSDTGDAAVNPDGTGCEGSAELDVGEEGNVDVVFDAGSAEGSTTMTMQTDVGVSATTEIEVNETLLALDVTKDSSPESGDDFLTRNFVRYEISVHNPSDILARDVHLYDVLPDGISVFHLEEKKSRDRLIPRGCSLDSEQRLITCGLGDIPAGSFRDIEMILRMDEPVQAVNRVRAESSNGHEGEAENLTSIHPNLRVDASGPTTKREQGQEVPFQVIISNPDVQATPNVEVRITGSNMTLISGAEGCVNDTKSESEIDVRTCDVGSLGAGESKEMDLVYLLGDVGYVGLTASATSDDGRSDQDLASVTVEKTFMDLMIARIEYGLTGGKRGRTVDVYVGDVLAAEQVEPGVITGFLPVELADTTETISVVETGAGNIDSPIDTITVDFGIAREGGPRISAGNLLVVAEANDGTVDLIAATDVRPLAIYAVGTEVVFVHAARSFAPVEFDVDDFDDLPVEVEFGGTTEYYRLWSSSHHVTIVEPESGLPLGGFSFDLTDHEGDAVFLVLTDEDDQLGLAAFSGSAELVTTPTERQFDVPNRLTLLGNYPNPFNSTTNLQVDLPETAEVRVTVYDATGRLVLTVPEKRMSAGYGLTLRVDGSRLTSGVYFYQVVATTARETLMQTGRMVVVK